MANLIGQAGGRHDETRAVLASGFERREACLRAGLAGILAAGELRSQTGADWPAASTPARRQSGLILPQARRDPYARAKPWRARSPSSAPTANPRPESSRLMDEIGSGTGGSYGRTGIAYSRRILVPRREISAP
jgi:hypothetical protein